jgi:Competence protein A.
MAYSHWQVGLHVQPADIVCVALQKTRFGRALRRWWRLPLQEQASETDIITLLRRLQRELPRYHRLAVAIPASDTLQKQLPSSGMILRESEQFHWIGNAIAQQVEMPVDALVFDYRTTDTKSYRVTAARRSDVERLQRLFTAAGLNLCAIAPDASALQHFLPWMDKTFSGITWRDGEQWLWATQDAWGCSPEKQAGFVPCTTQPDEQGAFNPWFPLNQLQPPLPEDGDRYAIALALALGVS